VDPRWPALHLLVHPATAPLAVDDADAFADGVENQVGLLGDQGAFEGEKIAGIGEDGVEVVVAQGLDGLVNGGDLDDVGLAPERIDNGFVGSRLPREHQDFVARIVQTQTA